MSLSKQQYTIDRLKQFGNQNANVRAKGKNIVAYKQKRTQRQHSPLINIISINIFSRQHAIFCRKRFACLSMKTKYYRCNRAHLICCGQRSILWRKEWAENKPQHLFNADITKLPYFTYVGFFSRAFVRTCLVVAIFRPVQYP